MGPATLRTFFGPHDIEYTVPQLLRQLRFEPLPTTSILLMNDSCQKRKITIDTELPNEARAPLSWTLQIGETTLPIMHHPNTTQTQGLKRGNVWQWSESDPRSKLIYEFLLPSGETDTDYVINFFCGFYNRRAIPRRKAVAFPQLVKLSEEGAKEFTFQQRLDILANEEQSNCELMEIPAPVDTLILGVILYPRKTTATIYNWTGKGELEVKLSEVDIFITCVVYLVQQSTRLMVCNLTGSPINLISWDKLDNGNRPDPTKRNCQ